MFRLVSTTTIYTHKIVVALYMGWSIEQIYDKYSFHKTSLLAFIYDTKLRYAIII